MLLLLIWQGSLSTEYLHSYINHFNVFLFAKLAENNIILNKLLQGFYYIDATHVK